MRLHPLFATLLFPVLIAAHAEAQQNRPSGRWDCQS